MRRRVLQLVLAAITACAAVPSCRPLLRYPVLERHPARPQDEIAANTLNPFVLSNLISKRLVVEIDWVEGYAPSELAMRDFRKTLDKYCPVGKSIEVVLDDAIPRERWEALSQEGEIGPLAAEFLDHDPRRVREYELVYVLYLPDTGEQGLFGEAGETTFERCLEEDFAGLRDAPAFRAIYPHCPAGVR